MLTAERYSEFPDVATMREQGFPDYNVPVWFGTYAPVGAPSAILDKLHREIATIHDDAEFRAKQFAGGTHVYREVPTLPQLQARIAEDCARYAVLTHPNSPRSGHFPE